MKINDPWRPLGLYLIREYHSSVIEYCSYIPQPAGQLHNPESSQEPPLTHWSCGSWQLKQGGQTGQSCWYRENTSFRRVVVEFRLISATCVWNLARLRFAFTGFAAPVSKREMETQYETEYRRSLNRSKYNLSFLFLLKPCNVKDMVYMDYLLRVPPNPDEELMLDDGEDGSSKVRVRLYEVDGLA